MRTPKTTSTLGCDLFRDRPGARQAGLDLRKFSIKADLGRFVKISQPLGQRIDRLAADPASPVRWQKTFAQGLIKPQPQHMGARLCQPTRWTQELKLDLLSPLPAIANFRLIVRGTGIGPVGTAVELEAAINDGIAEGQFD